MESHLLTRYNYHKALMLSFLFTLLLLALIHVNLNYNPVSAVKEIYPVSGTWNGSMGEPATISWQEYEVVFFTNMSGTFDGDTSGGDWLGEYETNFQVLAVNIEGKDVGPVDGDYDVTIDESGVISGDGSMEITGVLTGNTEFEVQGLESELGEVKGTWSGTLNAKELLYEGKVIPLNTNIEVSGEFEGMETRPEAYETPPTPTVQPTPTPTPTDTPVAPQTPSPAQEAFVIVPTEVAIIVMIVIIIVAIAGFFLYSKRKSK
jgi:hypothetical protein